MSISKLMILEPPVDGVKYWMGTDPIPFHKQEATMDDEERSQFASVILRDNPENPEAPYPVAYYMVRTNNSQLIFNEITALQFLYNNCTNLIERTRAEVLLGHYMEAGMAYLLASNPYSVFNHNWRIIKIPREKRIIKGWEPGAHNKDTANQELINWLVAAVWYIWDKLFFDQLRVYGLENTDLIDALKAAILNWRHDMNVLKYKYREKKPLEATYYSKDANGRLTLRKTKIYRDGGPTPDSDDGMDFFSNFGGSKVIYPR